VKTQADPRERPAYTLAEAATYAGISTHTAGEWVRGRPERKPIGRRSAQPLIRPASRSPCLLSFTNLVELFVLADLRRVHGVPLQRVRTALRYVEKHLGIARPLVDARFKTDGLDMFVEHLAEPDAAPSVTKKPRGAVRRPPAAAPVTGALVNASAGGQVAIRQALETRLSRVEFDDTGFAVRLFPLVRRDSVQQPHSIMMDPQRGFGRPVLAATGIRTSIVADRFFAGESYQDLADDYGVPLEQIEDAVRCEQNRTAA
jgi:uncharacterized protein (DUF433 family)